LTIAFSLSLLVFTFVFIWRLGPVGLESGAVDSARRRLALGFRSVVDDVDVDDDVDAAADVGVDARADESGAVDTARLRLVLGFLSVVDAADAVEDDVDADADDVDLDARADESEMARGDIEAVLFRILCRQASVGLW
jgi:hypothetical protein